MSTSTREVLAAQVWQSLNRLVLDNKDTWRRAVVTETALPFSRVRILLKLSRKPLTVKELADAATIDAPAATVAVNDLEVRGLVVREVDPDNRRSKLVSLTEAGLALLAAIREVDDPAPPALYELSDDDLVALQAILAKVAG